MYKEIQKKHKYLKNKAKIKIKLGAVSHDLKTCYKAIIIHKDIRNRPTHMWSIIFLTKALRQLNGER